jgi:phosphoribosylformylglycinamidine synthase
VPDATEILAAAQAAGVRAAVVGRAKGRDFASGGADGDLFRLPLDHLREMHEGWMPGWIEAVA